MDGWVVATLTTMAALAMCATVAGSWRHVAARRKERLDAYNPHARMLGREVEARTHRRARWERCVVVAVSWKGAVCVRTTRNPQAPGRWIPKELAGERVREVDG